MSHGESVRVGSSGRVAFTLAIGHSSSPELISFLTLEKENLNDINHNMLFTLKFSIGTSRKGDEDRD